MKTMTSKERIEKAVNLEEADRVPCAPLVGYYIAAAADMTPEDVLFDPEKAEQAWEITYKKHGSAFDLSSPSSFFVTHIDVYPNMFSTYYLDWSLPGRERSADSIPNLKERASEEPVMKESDYDKLIDDGFYRFFSLERAGLSDIFYPMQAGTYYKKYNKKWREEYQVPTLIDGSINTPFDVLSVLRGSTNFMIDLYKRPDKILAAIESMQDGMIAAGLEVAKMSGAETILLGAARGSADFISPKMFEKFVLPFMVRASHALNEAGYRIHYHFDTDWTPMLEYFKEFPAKSGFLHIDERTDIFKAKEVLGNHLCLLGNLKPSLFSFGTPEEVMQQTRAIIEKCAPGGGIILSSELPDMETKPECVQAMVDAVLQYGSYT